MCRDEGRGRVQGGGRVYVGAAPSARAYAPAPDPRAINIEQSIGNYNPHFAALCYTVNVELCFGQDGRPTGHRPDRDRSLSIGRTEMARNVQVSSREFLFDANGLHCGIRFTFGTGSVYDVMMKDLAPKVRAHSECNGLGEAFRDTGAGKSAVAAEAAFLKRLEVVKGGEYSARGGSRLDWIGDILEAVRRIMKKAGKELSDKQWADLEEELVEVGKDGTDGYKAWLKVNKTRKAIGGMVDLIRKERAAARAKVGQTDVDIDDII